MPKTEAPLAQMKEWTYPYTKYLDGSCSLEEAVYVIKRETRHFAKRQLTWFRREKDVIWLDKSEFNDREDHMLQKMTDVLHEKGIIQ